MTLQALPPLHPAAELVPRMSAEEYTALRESIREHGRYQRFDDLMEDLRINPGMRFLGTTLPDRKRKHAVLVQLTPSLSEGCWHLARIEAGVADLTKRPVPEEGLREYFTDWHVPLGDMHWLREPSERQAYNPLDAPRKPVKLATDWIYFIQSRDGGPIKIVTAISPKARLGQIQLMSPVPLQIVSIMRGGYERERELHQRFAASRSHGEWFHVSLELLAFIAAATEGVDPDSHTIDIRKYGG